MRTLKRFADLQSVFMVIHMTLFIFLLNYGPEMSKPTYVSLVECESLGRYRAPNDINSCFSERSISALCNCLDSSDLEEGAFEPSEAEEDVGTARADW